MAIQKKSFILFIILLGLTLVVLYSEKKEDDKEKNVAEMLIARERAELNRWDKGDPWGYAEHTASEITYFDPSLERRLDGYENFRKLLTQVEGKIKILRYEMINPKVQIHGDTAVLTYNLIDIVPTPEGSTKEVHWNSTEIFTRINGKWKRIHSHWSYSKSPSQE